MKLHIVLFALAFLGLGGCGDGTDDAERERAIEAARASYEQAVAAGVDLSPGPRLGDPVIPGWVADVAHEPREPVDDEPANQCASYRSGEAGHVVELDVDGTLIRAE
jgi:hypothetical protein